MQLLRLLALLAIASFGGLCVASAQTPPASPSASQPDPTTVMCLWGVMSSMVAVGDHCHAGQNAALQTAMRSSVTRLETYIASQAGSGALDQQRQRLASATNADLCRGDASNMYAAVVSKGPAWPQEITDQVLSGANHDGCF